MGISSSQSCLPCVDAPQADPVLSSSTCCGGAAGNWPAVGSVAGGEFDGQNYRAAMLCRVHLGWPVMARSRDGCDASNGISSGAAVIRLTYWRSSGPGSAGAHDFDCHRTACIERCSRATRGTCDRMGGTIWRVSGACGGINYLIACVAVAYVYAGVSYRRWGHRLMFVSAAAGISLGGNCIRVYSTILLDYAGATRVAAGMGHELYGVLVFAVMVSVLLTTCGRWHEERPVESSSSPRSQIVILSGSSKGHSVRCAIVAMLLVACGPVVARVL